MDCIRGTTNRKIPILYSGFRAPEFIGHLPAIVKSDIGVFTIQGGAAYVDDLLIYSDTMEGHNKILEEVLTRFRKYNLRVSAKKAQIVPTRVNFLGVDLSTHGAQPSPAKTAVISAMGTPSNVTELQRVLGSFNFYSHFIEG